MIAPLIQSASSYLPNLNETRLRAAFAFAKMAHEGQARKDGTPYITHPVAAAIILTEMHVDEDVLIACLLHDVPEDTEYTLEDINERFGETVAFLVEGITKLSKVYYRHDMETRQIESLKKLFIHSAQDPRIILIKLADRLHNMSTLDAIPKPEKRQRIARETLEIYVPIANLLGIWTLKTRLEDHCFRILLPKEYGDIDAQVRRFQESKKNMVAKSVRAVEAILQKQNVEYIKIEGRQKNHYSIFKKMVHHNKSFEDIYDLVGIRIVTKDVGQCYQVLGLLHQNFTPKIGRLKDYIAIPKSNGYQGIHTTVFGVEGTLTECQIRTLDMNLENKYGIAAEYFYDEQAKKNRVKKKMEKKYDWVQRILELQRDAQDNQKFMKDLKLDIFKDRIFIFTPRGDVVDLPQGATVVDFAYHIHSDVGMLATHAKVNGKKQPLNTRLKSGDVVYVHTSEESNGPELEWVHWAQTNLAKNRIKEFLKEKDRTELMDAAEHLLDHTLQRFGFEGARALSKRQRMALIDHFEKENWEELLATVGHGQLDTNELISVLYTDQQLFGEERDPAHKHVYEEKIRAQGAHVAVREAKVHPVTLCLDVKDRIGVLGDVSGTLGSLRINIIQMHSFESDIEDCFRLQFMIEIRDAKHYEEAYLGLSRIPGVVRITRHQEDRPKV